MGRWKDSEPGRARSPMAALTTNAQLEGFPSCFRRKKSDPDSIKLVASDALSGGRPLGRRMTENLLVTPHK